MMGKLLISALAATGIALGAQADPSGVWEFRTDIRDKGCSISGIMTIEPSVPGTSVRGCSFVSAETCGALDMEPVKMEQSCRIIQQDTFLIIRSEVIASLTEGRGIAGYLPDHFSVRPTEPGRMAGTWHDRNYSDLVEFWRTEGGATS